MSWVLQKVFTAAWDAVPRAVEWVCDPPERDVSVSAIMWGIFSSPLLSALISPHFSRLAFRAPRLIRRKNVYEGISHGKAVAKRLFLTLSVPEGISTQIWQRTLGRKLTRHIECLTAERLFKALNQQPDTVKTRRECGGRALTWAETRVCHSPDLTSAF